MKTTFRVFIVIATLIVSTCFTESAFASYLYEGPSFEDPYGNASTTAYVGKCYNCCWSTRVNGKPVYDTCQTMYVVSGNSCRKYYLGGSSIKEPQTYDALGGNDVVSIVKSGSVTMPSACAHAYGTPKLYPLNFGGYIFDIYGGNGNDTIAGGAGDTFVYGDSGRDLLFTADYAYARSYGGYGDDLIYGSESISTEYLYGEAGNDVLCGGTGAYRLDGGSDNDSCTETNVSYRRNCERNDAQAVCGDY